MILPEYVLFIAAFNALFSAVLILQKEKALHDKILIVWLLYLGLYIGAYGFLPDTFFTDYPLLSASFISLLMLHGPFLYFYTRSLALIDFKITGRDLYHLAPFALFNFFLLIASFSPGMSSGIRLDHVQHEQETSLSFNIFLTLTALSGPLYFLLCIRLFRHLDANISRNFSTLEKVNLDWLRKLVLSFGIVWTIFVAFAAIHHVFHLFSWDFCTDGLFLSLSAFVILIGYFGIKQQVIFVQYPERKREYVTEARPKYAGVTLEEKDAEEYVSRLQRFMDREKPYLDPNLSLPDLAEKLQMPSHLLSRVLNERLNLNFFDFVNQYRVRHVQALIHDPSYSHLSLLGIAFESGFNTKSAFNRVFKKMTGQTPSQFKNAL